MIAVCNLSKANMLLIMMERSWEHFLNNGIIYYGAEYNATVFVEILRVKSLRSTIKEKKVKL